MAFQTPITIVKALGSIERSEYALPATPARVRVGAFEDPEALRQPDARVSIGSFLFWRVGRDSIKEYQFYDFMLHYHQRDNRRLPGAR